MGVCQVIKCTQLSPERVEEEIGYEDTLEKFESVTSGEYIKTHKELTDSMLSTALADKLPYNYCIERNGEKQKGTVYMTSAFATKLATLAYGLSEWLLEYYAGTRCFARLNFDNCDALTDVQALPIANHVLNEEEGDLYDVTWKRYAEAAAKDLIPKEGLSDKKYAAVCRCFEEKLCVIVYRTAVLLEKHPEKLCLTCRIETGIFNFAKIVFSEMLAAKIPAMCGA